MMPRARSLRAVVNLAWRDAVLKWAAFTLGEDKTLGENHLLICDLSPDGTRLALAHSPAGPIEVHSLRDQQMLTIPTTGFAPLRHIV
jgi:hypothetical protein